MYEAFYGLRSRPFDLTPDVDYLLLTGKHQEALAHLTYGMTAGTGITLLLGEPGTGKTTLVNKAIAARPSESKGRVLYLTNPTLSRYEFVDFLANGFGLTPAAARMKTQLLRELQRPGVLGSGPDAAVLVIDEAQSLSDELLEEVRLLANMQSSGGASLRVLLAGQPGLGDRLNLPRFNQLKQRIALRCRLWPLDLHETAGYIAYRIGVAGGQPARVFSRSAVVAIHERSGGIPRTINVIADNALLTGFAADQRPVEEDLVLEACADLDLMVPGDAALREAAPPMTATSERYLSAPGGLGGDPDVGAGPWRWWTWRGGRRS